MQKRPDPEDGPQLIGYARVSTEEQKLDLQIDALRKAGVHDDHLHVEKVSGASKKRPLLDMAIKDLREGDTFLVWRLDRLARSMRDLYRRLDEIYEHGASFKSITENFDFGTATGKFVLGIIGLVAELERQLTIQRTTAGIQAWRERGGKPGRTVKMDAIMLARCVRLLRETRYRKPRYKTEQVAKMLKVAKSSIAGHLKIAYTKSGRRVVTRRTK